MRPSARLVGTAGSVLVGGLLRTMRWDAEENPELEALLGEGRPVIYVFWHGRLLPLAYHHRGRGIHTLISRNRDGEYIARVVERWGYRPVRGSSSRGGGVAMRGLIRALRQGSSAAVTPDGPRGPREVMKPGVIALARASGAPLVTATASPTAAWSFGSWDRFLVPHPFSAIRVRYGSPWTVPREMTEGDVLDASRKLEAELRALTERNDREAGWGG